MNTTLRFLLNARRGGAALLVTLAMLVLLSGIVVAFLTSVRTDLSASKSYEDSTSARMLADSALNLVIGQIREASTQPREAWISQPGLIRTFQQNGQPGKAYKLYSAEELVVGGGFDPAKDAASGTGDLPPGVPASDPQHWNKKPALWTDLNEPVGDLTRQDPNDPKESLKVYPIFDANYLKAGSDGKTGLLSLIGNTATPDVEGFRIEDYDKRGAAMPVRWLYMLKDGTLVGAREKGDGDAQLMVPAGKDKTADGKPNPIVARLAFWTDDETAKVNVNTASEGTFWDTPVCNTQPDQANAQVGYKTRADFLHEWDLAEHMGGIREYQRYPGHPAMTCLSTVFGEPLRLRLGLKPADLQTGSTRAQFIEELMKIAPRVAGMNYETAGEAPGQDYSSRGGTMRAGTIGAWGSTSWQTAGDQSLRRVVPDDDRLYATLDEMAFLPPMLSPAGSTDRTGTPLAGKSDKDTSRELLEMAKFFLTANSKAPEQNLYNLPRVAVWPVRDETARRTAFDKLITFCSTVGNKNTSSEVVPMIFQRNKADSGTHDWQNIQNNQRVYEYLRTLTSRATPGWKASGADTFAAKFGQDHQQILTEIFDYIRCTNLVDQSDPGVPNAWYTNPEIKQVLKKGGQEPIEGDNMLSKRGQVVPIALNSNGTRGFGRIATISELALVFQRKSDDPLAKPTWPTGTHAGIECMILPELFCPMAGFSSLANDIRLKFSDININVSDGKSTQAVFTQEPFHPDAKSSQPDLYDIGRITDIEDYESKIGGTIGARSLIEPKTNRQPPNIGAPVDSAPPTADFTVDKERKSMVIEGSVKVEIFAPANSGQLVQTFVFTFPKTTVPLPTNTSPTTNEFCIGASGSRKKGAKLIGDQWVPMFGDLEVVRSLTPVGLTVGGKPLQGDMRLVAAKDKVASEFTALPSHRYFGGMSRFVAAGLRPGWAQEHAGFAPGALVAGMTGQNWGYRPDVPEGINGVVNYPPGVPQQPGDWDNGPAWVQDGPLLNKADEGTSRHHHGSSGGLYKEEGAPYVFYNWVGQNFDSLQPTFFSPNRQISSPIMLGSLPTGVKRGLPWQTLLFRPARSYLPGGVNHPGSASSGPPDHLLLDLFWMPIVEPYAISEPFATAGKINLNSQIAPFTHMKRNTGLHAVMKAVKITALNPRQKERGDDYKQKDFIVNYKKGGAVGLNGGDGGGIGVSVRRNIDVDNTIRQIEDRLDKNKPFISASEICNIPLIPADMPAPMTSNPGFSKTTPLGSFESKLASFWNDHKLTGDNSLERPYSMIYPRLTTRSNSYTVHVRVQVLRKIGADPDKYVFKHARDQVLGEFRGSFALERYLDPNLAGFVKGPDQQPAKETDPEAVLGPYRFRVVSSKQFVP